MFPAAEAEAELIIRISWSLPCLGHHQHSTEPSSRHGSGVAQLHSGQGSGSTPRRPYCFGHAYEMTAWLEGVKKLHLGPKAKTIASCGARLPNFHVARKRAPQGRDTGRPPGAVPRPRKAPPRPGLLAQPIAEFVPAYVRHVGRFGWERRARGVCGVGVEARHRPRGRVAEAKGAVSRQPALRRGAQLLSTRPGGGSGNAGGTADRRLVRTARPPGTRGRRARGAQPPGPHPEASAPRPEAPHPARAWLCLPRACTPGPLFSS